MKDDLFSGLYTCVSISIYTLELKKKSSVTVTFTLFLNAQLTFSPVKYLYCVLHRLLLSIQYPNVEEININVLVLFILKKLFIAFWSVLSLTSYLSILLNDRNCNIQPNNQPSKIKLFLMKLINIEQRPTTNATNIVIHL